MLQVSAGGGRKLLSDWPSEQGGMGAAVIDRFHRLKLRVRCELLAETEYNNHKSVNKALFK